MHAYTRTLNTPVGRRSLSSSSAKPISGDVVTCQPRLAGAYFSPSSTCAGNEASSESPPGMELDAALCVVSGPPVEWCDVVYPLRMAISNGEAETGSWRGVPGVCYDPCAVYCRHEGGAPAPGGRWGVRLQQAQIGAVARPRDILRT